MNLCKHHDEHQRSQVRRRRLWSTDSTGDQGPLWGPLKLLLLSCPQRSLNWVHTGSHLRGFSVIEFIIVMCVSLETAGAALVLLLLLRQKSAHLHLLHPRLHREEAETWTMWTWKTVCLKLDRKPQGKYGSCSLWLQNKAQCLQVEDTKICKGGDTIQPLTHLWLYVI